MSQRRWAWGLMVIGLGCSSESSSPTGSTSVVSPPDPCPPAYSYKDGFCELREVFIAGGTFTMGRGRCPQADVFEANPGTACPLTDMPRQVTVPPFYVDAAPAYQRRFACSGKSCTPSRDDIDTRSPRVERTKGQTTDGWVSTPTDSCLDVGRRLIREDEWEFVVTAGGTRTYPWGDEAPTCEHLWPGFDSSCALPEPIGNLIDGTSVPLDEGLPILDHPPSPEGLYDLVHYLPHKVAPRPDLYDATYRPIPLEFPHSKAIAKDFGAPECKEGPDDYLCDSGDCPEPPHGYKCEHRQVGVRGGRAMNDYNRPLDGSPHTYERPLDAYKGHVRSLAYREAALVRCVRDAL